jgi:hypothetical protein
MWEWYKIEGKFDTWKPSRSWAIRCIFSHQTLPTYWAEILMIIAQILSLQWLTKLRIWECHKIEGEVQHFRAIMSLFNEFKPFSKSQNGFFSSIQNILP